MGSVGGSLCGAVSPAAGVEVVQWSSKAYASWGKGVGDPPTPFPLALLTTAMPKRVQSKLDSRHLSQGIHKGTHQHGLIR